MEKIKADLHMYGPIGFQPYWLEKQEYAGKNLLKLIADVCFKRERDIGICAITSESDQTDENSVIERYSVHDRLGYLEREFLSELNLLPYYEAEKFGPNSIVVKKDKKQLYLISGQTPVILDNGKRLDHLVIGSSAVPNFRTFKETIDYCNDNNLLHGLEHPALKSHFGIGLEKAKEYIELCDFVEGHNAQLALHRMFSSIPIIGQYSKSSNDKSKEFAQKHNKPYISTSDAHRIEDAGIASIEFDKQLLNPANEEMLLQSLKNVIKSNAFESIKGYENMLDWINWTFKLKIGILGNRWKK